MTLPSEWVFLLQLNLFGNVLTDKLRRVSPRGYRTPTKLTIKITHHGWE